MWTQTVTLEGATILRRWCWRKGHNVIVVLDPQSLAMQALCLRCRGKATIKGLKPLFRQEEQ